MRLILVRHGETEDNLKGIAQGWKDTSLSKTGIEQAKLLANRLKDEKIDFIYSSDLSRAKRTAEEIDKFHNKEIIFDKRIREINKGTHSGRDYEINSKEVLESGKLWYEFLHPNGESFEDLKNRSIDFINYLYDNFSDKTILIITHGGVLSCLLYYFNKKPFGEKREFHHNNTSVTFVEKSGEGWDIIKLNCTEHLK